MFLLTITLLRQRSHDACWLDACAFDKKFSLGYKMLHKFSVMWKKAYIDASIVSLPSAPIAGIEQQAASLPLPVPSSFLFLICIILTEFCAGGISGTKTHYS